MTGVPTPDEIEAAAAALQAEAQNQPKLETGSTTADIIGGALDIAGNVTIDVIGTAAGAVLEGVGTAVVATGEAVVTVIGGIFEGLSS